MALNIQQNVPLKDKNWFATGGSARFFCEPTTALEFQQALAFAHEHALPLFVLGQGANILISDEGFDGLVLRPMLKEIEILSAPLDTFRVTRETLGASGGKYTQNTHTSFQSTASNLNTQPLEHKNPPSARPEWPTKEVVSRDLLIRAGAGVTMHDLIEYCLDHQAIGLEEFSGIPGTVGGSVYINLHYFEFLLEQFLVEAQVIHKKTGEITTVNPDWFHFGYDHSRLHDHEHFLIDATFKLTQTDALGAMYARGRRTEIIRHRTRRYPTTHTCGSFFRNFHDHEVTLISNGKKMIYAAYYLDKIGVKGHLHSGDAIVSYQHANMLVNRGNATSTDIITLARTMQELVGQQFGIIPQPECQLIGFKEWPLL